MSENTNIDTGAEGQETTATDTNDNTGMISMTQSDLDKKIQSAADKVRRELSEKNRKLEAEIIKLTPAKKTKAEIELENRLSELETKQLEIESKEKDLVVRAALQEANLDKSIADFVKADIDVAALCTAVDKIVNARIAAQGYVPTNHESNTGITKEQFRKLSYDERVALSKSNPDLIQRLMM